MLYVSKLFYMILYVKHELPSAQLPEVWSVLEDRA